MKNFAIKAAGWLLSRPPVFWLLQQYAFRTPHQHLYDKPDADGVRSLYMGRWRVVDEGTFGSWLLKKLTGKYVSVRLHHINRPDHDRHLHSHPFGYRTFILKGHYSESYQDGVEFAVKDASGFFKFKDSYGCGYIAPTSRYKSGGYRWVHTGQSATGTHDKFHRIDMVSKGGVWTLFFMDQNLDAWGFKVDHRLVDSKRYFIKNGYDRETIRAVQNKSGM